MAAISNHAQLKAAMAATTEERARQAALGPLQDEAEKLAVRARTARLYAASGE